MLEIALLNKDFEFQKNQNLELTSKIEALQKQVDRLQAVAKDKRSKTPFINSETSQITCSKSTNTVNQSTSTKRRTTSTSPTRHISPTRISPKINLINRQSKIHSKTKSTCTTPCYPEISNEDEVTGNSKTLQQDQKSRYLSNPNIQKHCHTSADPTLSAAEKLKYLDLTKSQQKRRIIQNRIDSCKKYEDDSSSE